jgi:hypothetical protein
VRFNYAFLQFALVSENASGCWAFSEAGVRKNAMQQRALNSDVGMDLCKILILKELC